YAHSLGGGVLVHVQGAVAQQRQGEAAVACEQRQHVVEEVDAGRDVILAAAVARQRPPALGLSGAAVERGRAGLAAAGRGPRTARAFHDRLLLACFTLFAPFIFFGGNRTSIDAA